MPPAAVNSGCRWNCCGRPRSGGNTNPVAMMPARHTSPPIQIAAATPQASAMKPARALPTSGAGQVADHLDAGKPPTQSVRDGLVPDRAAEHATDHVGRAGHCQARQPEHQAGRKAQGDDAQRPHGRRDHDRAAVAFDPAGPAAEEPDRQGAHRHRRQQPAHGRRAPIRRCHGREQRDREREGHRHDVDDVGPHQLGSRPTRSARPRRGRRADGAVRQAGRHGRCGSRGMRARKNIAAMNVAKSNR